MATYEIIESKAHLVTADSEDEAYRKFGNYEHDEESDYITSIRKIDADTVQDAFQKPFYSY
jgi:ABC-type transport system substrate-binding protein